MQPSLTRTEHLLIIAEFGRGNHPRSQTRPVIDEYRDLSKPAQLLVAASINVTYALYGDLIAVLDFNTPTMPQPVATLWP